MSRNWFRRPPSAKPRVTGGSPRPAMKRRRRTSLGLVIQELEPRTLLSVTASLSAGVLDVQLGAAGDQVTIQPAASSISVSGTGYAVQSFSNVSTLVIQGSNTATRDDPNEGVTFGGGGGTITLHAAPGTDALRVGGVTSVSFTNVAINATSGNIDVVAFESTSAEPQGAVGSTAPVVSIGLSGASLTADNVTLDAHAASEYKNNGSLGGELLKEFPALGDVPAYGFAAAIADVEPSATVAVVGSSSVRVNGSGGNITIGSEVEARVESVTKVGTTIFGSALNPVDAAIAVSIVSSSAITHIGGGSSVSAGVDTGVLRITSNNTTDVKTEVDGSAAVGGGSAAVTLDDSTSQAFVDGGSNLTGGSVDVTATTINTAETIAKSTATGAGANAAIKNMLAGQVDPAYLDEKLKPDPRRKTSPALTAASGGLPIAVSAALAVTKFTPTTQAYVDSSAITATNAVRIVASSNNNTATDTDSSTTTANAISSVGVAVAISNVVAGTTATVENTSGTTTLRVPNILVQAATPTASVATPDILNASAKATSGVSGANVGLAGALALNIVSDISEASVPSGSTVSMVGDVTFLARDSVTETATAHPPEEERGAESGGVGVGASVALNIAGNTTLADLQDNAQLTGAGNLTFAANSTDAVATNAVAGSSGGAVSISPSVGISVVTNTTAAQVGTPDAANDPLLVGGSFSATATHAGVASTPTGAASGAGIAASAGVAIALAYVTDQTTATTLRSLNAQGGGATFEADGSAASLVSANASASGGPTEAEESGKPNPGPADSSKAAPGSNTSDPNSVDGQNAQHRSYADRQSGTLTDSKGKSVSPGDTKKKANTPAAATSDGSITVAAAVAVNIVDSEAIASIPAGLTITAAGPLVVAANNDTGDPSRPIYGDTANAWGTAAGAAKIGVGAAVALNLVNASTNATIGASTINSRGLTVRAGMLGIAPMNAFGTQAVSGAGAGDIGLAGSVAIDIITNTSQALIATGATADAHGGDISLTSLNNSTDTSLALPGSIATGESLGIGASLGMNIVTDATRSEIQDGAALTNAGNVTVTADASHAISTWAQNGGAGKVALGGGIVIVIASDQTTARIGSAPATLNASGALTIAASGSFTVNSLADAAIAPTGGGVGVGASVVVNLTQDSFLAELARSVTAGGAVSVTAAATAASQGTAIASEQGAPPTGGNSSGSGGTADQETQNQSNYAHREGGATAPNVAAPPKSNEAMASPSSKATSKSGGDGGQTKVGIAAAVAVNVLTTSTIAAIDDGLSVTAAGLLTVGTTNQAGSVALADARATVNENSIGAAVSLNVASVTNSATIGAGDTVSAAGVNVAASMVGGAVNDFSTQALGVAIGTQAGVAGSAGINVITTTTVASIGAGTGVTSAADLNVRAAHDETLQNVALTLAVGAGVGAGAAVSVNVLNNANNAFLATNVRTDAAGMTQVAATSSFNPSHDPIPSSPAETIIATGTTTAGSDVVSGINAVVNGVLGRSSNAPMNGDLVTLTNTDTGQQSHNAILKFENTPFDAVLTFGSDEIVLNLATAKLLKLNLPDLPAPLPHPALKVGDTIGGPGIPGGATIVAIVYDPLHGAQITLSAPVYANGSTPLTATKLKLLTPETAGGPVTIAKLDAENTLADEFSKLHPTNFAAAAGVSSGGTAIAGAATINIVAQNTTASIASGAQINQNAALPHGTNQSVTVQATDAFRIFNVTGGLAAGGENGAGAGLDVSVIGEDTEASIGAAAKVAADRGVNVLATSTERLDATAIQLALGGELALAGAIDVEVLNLTTKAYVDNASTLTTQGNVLVQAQHTPTIRTIAGSVAVGGDAGLGASVSTVVETDDTEAYLGTGDVVTAGGNRGTMQVLAGDRPANTIAATGVAVQAATVSTVTAIAAGGAASGGVGIAGSGTINVLNFTTKADIGAGSNVTATNGVTGTGPGVNVLAYSPLSLFSTADALAAGGEVGAGAGVDVGALTKDTEAWIAPATVTAEGDILVRAISTEAIDSVTASAAVGVNAGIAASGGIYVIGTTTRAFIGDDPRHPIANPPATQVTAHGSILVSAQETTALDLFSGNFSGSGGLAVGAAVIVPVITKTTEAFVGANAIVTAWGQGNGVSAPDGQFQTTTVPFGSTHILPSSGGNVNVSDPSNSSNNDLNSPWFSGQQVYTPSIRTVNGLAVAASNQDDIEGVGIDAGVSLSVAINMSGSIGVIDDTTHAFIDSGAVINSSNPNQSAGGPLGSVLVASGNATSFLAVAGAVSISGDLSVTPGVVVLVITDHTVADIADGASVTAQGDVAVRAHSSGNLFSLAATGAGSATVGISGSLAFLDVNDTTLAYIGKIATTDPAPAKVNAGGNVLVEATDDTVAYLITGSVAIGVTGGGIGASVSIALLTKDTEAFIGSFDTVNALGNSPSLAGIVDGDAYAGGSSFSSLSSFHGVAVQAATRESITNFAAAGAGGFFVGLAGGIAVDIFRSKTLAYVGNDAQINVSSGGATASQAVNVSATNQAYDFSFAGGLGVGLAGIAGGLDVGLLQNATQAYVMDNATVDARQDVGVFALSNDNVKSYALAAGAGAVGLVGSVSVWAIGQAYAAGYQDGNAKDGTVSAVPSDKLSGQGTQTSTAEGQTHSASSTTGTLTDPKNNGAARNLQYISPTVGSNQGGVNGSVSGDPVDGAIRNAPVAMGTGASLGSGITANAGGNVEVEAKSQVAYTSIVGGVAAGLVAVGGSIAIATIQGGTQADIGANSRVAAGGSVVVHADLVHDVSNGTAFAGSAGLVAIGAQVIDIQDSSAESAHLGDNVTISQASWVTVASTSNRSVSASALGGSFGGVAAGVGVAIGNTTGGPSASIGSGDQVVSRGGVTVAASSVDVVAAKSYGVAGGVHGAATGVFASATAAPTTSATIGDDAAISAGGNVVVQSQDTPKVNAAGLGVAVSGAFAIGAVVSEANVSGTTSSYLGNRSSVSAPSLLVSASRTPDVQGDPTAQSSSIAGAGGILVGANVTVSTANSDGKVQATTGNSVSLPDGDVTIAATNTSDQSANASGVSLGGVFAVGGDVANAGSSVATLAQLGAGVKTNTSRRGTLIVHATGTDENDVKSSSGSGSLIPGNASVGNTTDTSTVAAILGGPLAGGAVPVIFAGTVDVNATNNSGFMPSVSSENAGIAGASGALATNNDTIAADAKVLSNTAIMASSAVNVAARNTFTERVPTSGSNVAAGAAGFYNAAAALSKTTLTGNANVTVGGSVAIDVQAAPSAASGIFLVASSLLNTSDLVTLSTAGAIQGIGTDSSLTAILNNNVTTNSSAASPDNFTTNQNIGIGTFSRVNAVNDSEAHSFGALGTLAAAYAETNVTSNQAVTLGPVTNLTAYQNINLTAGDDPTSGTNNPTTILGFANAQSYARGFVGVPIANASTNLVSNAALTVNGGDVIQSGANTTLAADSGVPSASAQGIGHGYELYFIPITNGTSTPRTSTSSVVTMNGAVTAGIFADLDINVTSPTTATFTERDTTIPVPATFIINPSFNPSAVINGSGFLGATDKQLLLGSVSSTPVTAIEFGLIDPLTAYGGNVIVNADTLSGGGKLTAHGAPTINITNNTADYLVLGAISIPDVASGRVVFLGTATAAPSGMAVAQTSLGASSSVNIQENYSQNVGNSSAGPAVFLTGEVDVLGGQVSVYDANGSIIQTAAINANQVDIAAPNGSLVVNAPNGTEVTGTSPFTQFAASMLWPGGNPSSQAVLNPTIAVAYVANAMLNANGQFGTDSTNAAANLRFTAAISGHAGDIPSSSFFTSTGGFNEPLLPQIANGVRQAGTSLEFIGANSGDDTLTSAATAGSQSPVGQYYQMGDASNRGLFPVTPVEPLNRTVAAYPSPPTPLTLTGTLASGSTTVTNLTSVAGLVVGESVIGVGIPHGATIQGISAASGTITLSIPATIGGTATITSGTSAINAARVLIHAAVIDVDSTINVGLPNNWSISLPSSLGALINTYHARGGSALYSLPLSTSAAGDSAIAAQYDAINNQIIVNNVNASSGAGYLLLDGAIMSTSPTGNIRVNDGNGRVRIDNQTGVPLVVNNVYAGAGGLNTPSPSQVDIVDRQTNVETLYVYTPGGGITTYRGAVTQAQRQLVPVSAVPGTTATSTSYSPQPGLRYQWQLQAELDRTVTQVQNNTNVPPYASTAWSFRAPQGESTANNPWYYLDADGNPTPVSGGVSTPSGHLVSAAANGPAFQETIGGSVPDWYTAFYVYHIGHYGFQPTNPKFYEPDGREKDPWVYYFAQRAQLTLTDSIKADNPIQVNFAGAARGYVSITSNAPLAEAGEIVNPNGLTAIGAPIITQGSTASITTNDLMLTAAGGIGTAAQPLSASLTANGALSAVASGPGAGVYLNLASGALLANVSAPSGTVVLNATGNLDVAPAQANSGATVVTASNIALHSSGGEIGTGTLPVKIHATGIVQATALKDIALTQDAGDLKIGQVASTSGNVFLAVPNGQIFNADGSSWSAVVQNAQSQRTWSALDLTNLNSAQVQNSVTAFENQVTSDYHDYWRLVDSGTVANGVLTLTPVGVGLYRPQAALALSFGDPGLLTSGQVQSFANGRYQALVAFFNADLAPGWMTSAAFTTEDPSYAYRATSQQVADLTRNAAWTPAQLQNAVLLIALDPAAGNLVGISKPTVAGVNVRLSAAGDIGQASGSLDIPIAALQSGQLTPPQLAAISQATAPGEILAEGFNQANQLVTFPLGQQPADVSTVTGIRVSPRAQVFVASGGTVTATSAGAITLQETSGNLTLGSVSAGGSVNISAPGSILGLGSGTVILTSADILLKAGTGIGQPGTPLIVPSNVPVKAIAPDGTIFIQGGHVTDVPPTDLSRLATATRVTGVNSSATFGESVNFTAIVSSVRGTPSGGTIQFLVDGVPFGSPLTPDANGIVALPIALPVGLHAITAKYSGDTTFAPTSSATETGASLTVVRATPTISWPDPSDIVYGTALDSTQLDAMAGVDGTFTYSPAVGTVLGAGRGQSLAVTFAPTDAADYTGAFASAVINVMQATPTITWVNPDDITYGTPLGVAQLNAMANVAGTFAYSPMPGTVLNAGGEQLLRAIFTPTDSINYAPATWTAFINVAQAAASIGVTPYAVTYDAAGHTATGTARGVGGADLGAGLNLAGTTHTHAGTYPGDAWSFHDAGGNYLDAAGTVNDSISQAAAAIAITPYAVTYDATGHTATGTAFGVAGLNLGTGLTLSGTTHTNAGTYPSDAWTFHDAVGNYKDASGTVRDVIAQAPAAITITPYAVTYDGLAHAATGTARGIGGVDLSSGLTLSGTTHTGAGTYNPDPWSFAGGINYISVVGGVNDTIAKAPLTITANNSGKIYGSPNPTFSDSYSGFVPGESPSNLGGAPTFTTSASVASPVGTYAVTPGGWTSNNYALTFVPGFLTVTINPGSVYVLDKTLNGAVTISGAATIKLPGDLVVDSSSSSAILAGGSASISALSVQVVGGISRSGNASVSKTGTPGATGDPYSPLVAPSIPAYGTPVAESLGGNSTASINPGAYSQIIVSGSATLTLKPGTYVVGAGGVGVSGAGSLICTGVTFVIQGGGMAVSGSGSISGSSVLIYNAASGSSMGGITLSGSGKFILSPATTGPDANILIDQPAANTRAISVSGSAALGIAGIIHAPSAPMVMSGNVSLNNTLVVGSLNLSGSVTLAQLASGSDGDADAVDATMSLRAGDLNVYVSDPAGYFTRDMLDRIRDSIAAWDAVLAPYHVTIREVGDPALANLILDDATISGSGSMSDGALGSYNPGDNPAEITIVQGWDWYAGADASHIGSSQYDFQTTVSHELGHALGLAGSVSPISPMNGTLALGTSRRAMTVADLNLPHAPESPDSLPSGPIEKKAHAAFGSTSALADLAPRFNAVPTSATPAPSTIKVAPRATPALGGPTVALAGPVTRSLPPQPGTSALGHTLRSGRTFEPSGEVSAIDATWSQPRNAAEALSGRVRPLLHSPPDVRGDATTESETVIAFAGLDFEEWGTFDSALNELGSDARMETATAISREYFGSTADRVPRPPFVVDSQIPADSIPMANGDRKPEGSRRCLTDLLLACGFCGPTATTLLARNRRARAIHRPATRKIP